MKRILLVATAVVAMALGLIAAASDPFQLVLSGPRGGVIGGVVKNAPYSGDEITTQDNVLGDGTHIHNETHTKVYRDAEGRTRRESDDMINIYDPVAGVAYILNPKTMTAHQVHVSTVTTVTKDGLTTNTVASGGGVSLSGVTTGTGSGGGSGVGVSVDEGSYAFHTNRVETMTVTDGPVSADAKVTEKMRLDKMMAAQALDQVKADTEARMQIIRMADGTMGDMFYFKTGANATAKKESLGTQVLEGITAQGTRSTSTFDTGAIGNDRPIHVVSERWVSPDLQTLVMTKHSDPRSGEEVFRLTNVNRNNPDPSLFQLPSGYTLAEERRSK